jgi:hypothetical protein
VQISKPSIDGTMYGMISTQFDEGGGKWTPIVAPIFYLKLGDADAPPESAFGELGPVHEEYKFYMGELRKTLDDGYIRIALPSEPKYPIESDMSSG